MNTCRWVTLILSTMLLHPATGTANPSLQLLARQAVSENPGEASAAIATLRTAGPEGLRALFDAHADAIQRKRASPALDDHAWRRVSAALDAVASQRDAWASGLYWFIDFEQAKAAARTSGKPILSLRLLGNLDEEFSCANSRFFRTVLYPNADVSRVLRERFVLHWKSVRPVPRVTIDFGDGRTLERTVTGNSVHYVLDADGRVVDVVPGLYGARAFLRELARTEAVARDCAGKTEAVRDAHLRRFHAERLAEIERSWADDCAKIGSPPLVVENVDDATWIKIAVLHSEDAQLDRGSAALVESKSPDAIAASRVAVAKTAVENPLLRALRELQRSVAQDTVRNEYVLHRKIHEWFAGGATTNDLQTLNRRVYAELFLSPLDDPWLGLAADNAYTALPDGGANTEKTPE